MSDYHIPVLLNEVLEALEVKPGEKYIDCTLGGAGHTEAILQKGGKVLGIDQDPEAIQNAISHLSLAISQGQLILKRGNFAHLKKIATEAGFDQIAGILFDLGVSSHQLETDYRGFSFNVKANLDMRMDPVNQTVTAADLVNAGSEKELAHLFWKFGEERAARAIAKKIVEERKNKKIETTDELAKVIFSVRKKTAGVRIHPATRVFQALRIAVNSELESLEAALPQAIELLEPEGKLAVISFHSLEDRIVKNYMRMNSNALRILTNKPVEPTKGEIERNPRARSGKLRVAEKI